MIRLFAPRPLSALSLLSLLVSTQSALAQVQPVTNTRPMAVPLTHVVPDPQDVAYPGTITLAVDATDLVAGAFRVTETVPVVAEARQLILLYPQWLPGEHGARGPLSQLVGIHFEANGVPLVWHRDPVEVNAFVIDVPEGTQAVVARFLHTSPLRDSEGRITVTRAMLNLQWEKMSLYPAGHYVRQVRIRPEVTLPEGWTVFTALDGKQTVGSHVTWGETDYETLVDSPLFAGAYAKRLDLGQNVSLDVVADKAADLDFADEAAPAYRRLVNEAVALFGTRHFDHYDFLLALSDQLGGIGLEHHRSSENAMHPRALVDWAGLDWDRNVLAHEFTHSWDGKFRRPARLWTPDFRQPMQDDLLWVYEGQTQFWGYVLAARSGVQSKDIVLGQIANQAGAFTQMPGRDWRAVVDTTADPVFAARRPKPFATLSRGEDYYTEGALVWLEADQLIRDGTQGRKGLDDFARLFFGQRDGDWGVLHYEFDDVVAALNAVWPHDWAGFLKARIYQPGQPVPLDGVTKGGYHLVWKDQPNAYDKARMADSHTLSLTHSLGVTIDKDGKVTACRWDSPAAQAGVVSGVQIVAVNGAAYEPEVLKNAITAASTNGTGPVKPIALLIRRDDIYATVNVTYAGGLRWPWLEHTAAGKVVGGLDRLLEPRTGGR